MKVSQFKDYSELPLFLNAEMVANKVYPTNIYEIYLTYKNLLSCLCEQLKETLGILSIYHLCVCKAYRIIS